MKSLLTRITDKAIEKGYGFRVDAYEMWNYGCTEFVTEYHTDINKLIDACKSVDGLEHIHFAKLDEIIPLAKKLKDNKLESVEDIKCPNLAFEMLAGEYSLRWINWGGNTGTDCLNDACSTTFWDDLELDKITDEYEEELSDFERF